MSMLDELLLRTVALVDRSGDVQNSAAGLQVLGAHVSSGLVDFGHINVTEFGAIGDGDHADTIGIQSAFDAAAASGRPCKVFFPPGVYRITAPLTLGRAFADVSALTLDYTSVIYGETPEWLDAALFAQAVQIPVVQLVGDGAALWLDFDSLPDDPTTITEQQPLTAGIFFGLPANDDRASMAAHSSMRGINIFGKYSFKDRLYVPQADQPDPELAGQVGVIFPGVTHLTFDRCHLNGLHTGYVATDCYWSAISQISTYGCAYGQRLHRHNAGHVYAVSAFNCTKRGIILCGQAFEATGLHTEGCVGDLWIPNAISSYAGHAYLENGSVSTAVPMLQLGDPSRTDQYVGRLFLPGVHCGVGTGLSSAPSVQFTNCTDVIMHLGDAPRVPGEYSYGFVGPHGSPPVIFGGQRTNELVDPSLYGELQQLTVESMPEPDFNTWEFKAGIKALRRLGAYAPPTNVDTMPIGNTYAGAFNGTATGSGVASFTQGAGVAAGAAYAENTSGAGTYHGYRSSGPKNNAVNNFHFSARITIPNASNYDFAVGLQSSVSTALAPSILIGVQRAVSTDHISLQVAANGGTTIGTVSGVSGVSCATGGQFELEMWWVRGDSHVYWAVNGVDQTPISCALIGTSDLGSAMLPGFWFSVASGATQVCYLERMRLGWS